MENGLLADEIGTQQLQLGRLGPRRRHHVGRGAQQCRAAAPSSHEARRPSAFLSQHGRAGGGRHHADHRPGQPDGEDGSWVKVPVEPVRRCPTRHARPIKAEPRLAKMELIRQSRLSVAPVRDEEWNLILEMAK